ncbi:MAG: DUF4956 domain-containing protein [Acidobacteria bacterium]|nr:DUF4956 domain-containing protein [Acidobacteriota bacterium]
MIRRKSRQIVVVAVVAALAGFLLAALFWSLTRTSAPQRPAGAQAVLQNDEQPAAAAERPAAAQPTAAAAANQPAAADPTAAAPQRSPAQKPGAEEEDFLSRVFGVEEPTAAEQAALAAMLAFRPRKDSTVIQRNLYVAQTQILLAVVASSLMMVVGDNAARAFGIFAAVSLVRFRTNIRDPKEITVLLISLSIGLATGVGRWELAVILALFVLPLLWFLEYNEEEQVFRAMELTVKTRDTDATQAAMQEIFRRHGMNAEVRQLDPPDADEPVGCIMYYVQMSLNVSTDQVNEEIMASDEQHVEAIEWDQQKNTAYVYQ